MTDNHTYKRMRRHRRVRAKVAGTPERPRLAVYKSNRQIIAQLIDDVAGKTIAGVVSSNMTGETPKDRAIAAARAIAERAKAAGVSKVVFDRGGFAYMATIKAFADAAREAGLEF